MSLEKSHGENQLGTMSFLLVFYPLYIPQLQKVQLYIVESSKFSGGFLRQDSQSLYGLGKIQNVGGPELSDEKKLLFHWKKISYFVLTYIFLQFCFLFPSFIYINIYIYIYYIYYILYIYYIYTHIYIYIYYIYIGNKVNKFTNLIY